MPYLTPEDIPEDGLCRPLLIPANSDWLAFFGGALTELTKTYNWQAFGALSVDDTVAKMQEIIDAWYVEPCEDCEIPSGGNVIRINADGLIEVLSGGEWVIPTSGDYFIPDPDAREGGTAEDQICLAAANAVNVLHELYDSLADSFASELTEAAALAAFAGIATTTIGFAFAPITAGIAAFFLSAFGLLYSALSYLTADLWTEDFEKQITCFLVECGQNDAGVVTFDWQCFNDKLGSLANEFSLSEVQIRLYIQVAFIIQFIGGADGVNLAGGTTAVEDADCSECVICESYLDPMLEGIGAKTRIVQVDPSNQTFWIYPTGSPDGEWTDTTLDGVDGRVEGTAGSPHGDYVAAVLIDLGTECLIDDWSFDYYKWGGSATCDLFVQWGAYDASGDYITGDGNCRGGGSAGWNPEYYLGFNTVARYLYFKVYAGSAGSSVSISDLQVTIS